MCHTVGCGMPSSVLPLTVDFLGLRMNACLTRSTCSSFTDGLPVLFLLHAPCLLKLCIPPSIGIVRWWLLPEFGAELPLDNCNWPTFMKCKHKNASSLTCSGEMHKYCTLHIIKENFENFLIHRRNYILLSQVYCVWQVVKTQTIIFNNRVLRICKYFNFKFYRDLCLKSLQV